MPGDINPESFNYAINLEDLGISGTNPSIIIPTGFDCGPSTILRGSLDRPRKKKLPNYYNPDLPFDTVLLKEVTPIIEYFLKNSKDKTLDDLTLDDFREYFLENNIKQNEKCTKNTNKFDVSFEHKGNYDTVDTSKMDMMIRIKNLLKILKDNQMQKLFFRKSHSECHHNNDYQYATEDIDDIKDSIDLCEYLNREGITNFIIILYLCCKKCYTTVNVEALSTNPHIFCFKTLDNNTIDTSPIFKTTPAVFIESVKILFMTKYDDLVSLKTSNKKKLLLDLSKNESSSGSSGSSVSRGYGSGRGRGRGRGRGSGSGHSIIKNTKGGNIKKIKNKSKKTKKQKKN